MPFPANPYALPMPHAPYAGYPNGGYAAAPPAGWHTPDAGMTVALPTTLILLVLAGVFLLESTQPGGSESEAVLRGMGAITPDTLSGGQLWRLVASMFLHIGPIHLLGNAIALFWLGRMAERLYGPLRFVGIYLLTGLGGAVLTSLVSGAALTAGASGAIWGIMGALLAGSWRNQDRQGRMAGREFRQSIVGVIILNALISLTPGVSLTGHLGGFLSGVALGLIIPFEGDGAPWTRALGRAIGVAALVASGALLLTAVA